MIPVKDNSNIIIILLVIIMIISVPNTEVLKRVGEKEQQFFRKIVQQKLAYAGHVKRKQWKKCIGNTRRKN